jgi:hypothetical protein
MLVILISILVFGAVFLLTRILVDRLGPPVVDAYNKWQQKRLDKVVNKLEDSFIFLEKKRKIFLSVCPLAFAGAGLLLIRTP